MQGLANFIHIAAARAARADSSSTSFLPTGLVQGGWANPTSGLGMPGADPTAALIYCGGHIPPAYMVDKLYTYDWLAQRVVEKMPSVAMVRGFRIAGDKDGGAKLIKEYQALNTTERFPHGCFERGVNDGRAYGGSVVWLGYTKGAPQTPLTDSQRGGGINFLDVFQQSELRVLKRVSDPSRANFGMPELYEVIAAGNCIQHPRVGQVFHASRAIRFSGAPLRVPYNDFLFSDATGAVSYPEVGVSVLTPILTVLGQYGLAWSAVSNMLQDASVGWMKLSGLIEALASDDKQLIEDRLTLLKSNKGAHRMMFLDADNNEEYGRTEVSLTDIPAVLQQFIVAVSGAADVPARIFFSTTPQGLNANASGEGDLIQLYNTCQDYQNRYLGPKLETILTAINGGTEVEIEWPSLWEASDAEQAQTRLANANASNIYWQMGACEASDIVKGAKTGVLPETLGTPDDNRIVLKSAEVGGDPNAPPADPSGTVTTLAGTANEKKPPQGAPGKQQASKIATKQRAAQKAGKTK